MKVKWMIITIFAPEVVFGKAAAELVSAIVSRDYIKNNQLANPECEWTLSHSFFTDMGGFRIHFDKAADTSDAKNSLAGPRGRGATTSVVEKTRSGESLTIPATNPTSNQPITQADLTRSNGEATEKQTETLTVARRICSRQSKSATDRMQRFYDDISTDKTSGLEAYCKANEAGPVRIGGMGRMGTIQWHAHDLHIRLVEAALETVHFTDVKALGCHMIYHNLAALQGDVWVLNTAQLITATELGIIMELPSTASDALSDKSKGDALVKLLAAFQICWLIAQLTIRKIQNRPSTQLEIMTLAFAACTFFTYLLVMFKPKDARTPIYIAATRSPTISEMYQIACHGPDYLGPHRRYHWMPNNAFHTLRPDKPGNHRLVFWLGSGSGAVLFGSLRLLAWNFAFPTRVERTLWIVSSFLCFVAPVAAIVTNAAITVYRGHRHWYRPGESDMISYTVGLPLLLPSFLLARLFILAEVFRTLAFLPTGAFIATWATNVPHAG